MRAVQSGHIRAAGRRGEALYGRDEFLQSLLGNVREATLQFAERFTDSARVPTELGKLLTESGIADPQRIVTNALATVAGEWGRVADQLKLIEFTDPASLMSKAGALQQSLDLITRLPGDVWNAFGASADAMRDELPKRLLDYILYHFILTRIRKSPVRS